MIILIDSGLLGLCCNPNATETSAQFMRWFDKCLIRTNVVSSQICDYEVKRGLLLAQKQNLRSGGLAILADLHGVMDFLPVSETILNVAAELWSSVRLQGQPTASENSLDADVIIGATYQDLVANNLGQEVVIATTNVRHISRYAVAVEWQDLAI